MANFKFDTGPRYCRACGGTHVGYSHTSQFEANMNFSRKQNQCAAQRVQRGLDMVGPQKIAPDNIERLIGAES